VIKKKENKMHNLPITLFLVLLPTLSYGMTSINNTEIYKPCIPGFSETNCPENQNCFRFFCYPKAGSDEPLKSCKKEKKDCKDPKTPKCYKNPSYGICVSDEDYDLCETHQGCQDKGLGDKCCGDYCCNQVYFDALLQISCNGNEVCDEVQKRMDEHDGEALAKSLICQTDTDCKSEQQGTNCCTDDPILKDVVLTDGIENWNGQKRCCMHENGKRLLNDLPEQELDFDAETEISDRIFKMDNKKEYCDKLSEPMQQKFQTCKDLKTAVPEIDWDTTTNPSTSGASDITVSIYTLIYVILFCF